jgi:hypothetical protein
MREAIQQHVAALLAQREPVPQVPELRRQTGLQQTRGTQPAQAPSASSASISATAGALRAPLPPGDGATDSQGRMDQANARLTVIG